ncbi:thioesterase II family protein [Streptomyces sp. NPDC048516]|uniref:thioesterase II family protein n=1 Tax=Streptomyces sp. NPDC048516 TaxID=3365565 RepID=UPI0037222377
MPLPTRDEDVWIRRFPTNPRGRIPLVCFPHAGGSASYFVPFSHSLAGDVDVLAVQYPGRQDRRREPLIDNIPELADRIFDILKDLPIGPLAFFGHSMGATVAFEVAQRFMQRTGTCPLWLFVSGRRAPSRHRQGSVHLCDDSVLVAELRKVGGTDPRLLADEELLSTFLPVTRNDYKAIETYAWTPAPKLDCPITAFVGDQDPQATAEEAAAWAGHTTGAFDLRVFPGGHFYLDEHRNSVTDAIASTIGGSSLITSAIEEPAL